MRGEVQTIEASSQVEIHVPAVCKIVGLLTAGPLAGVGQALSVMLRTVAEWRDMGASGMEWFVEWLAG